MSVSLSLRDAICDLVRVVVIPTTVPQLAPATGPLLVGPIGVADGHDHKRLKPKRTIVPRDKNCAPPLEVDDFGYQPISRLSQLDAGVILASNY